VTATSLLSSPFPTPPLSLKALSIVIPIALVLPMSTQETRTATTGTWSDTEDERLREAVAKHGPRWMSVAAEVGTRSGEQCAKRWNEYVNPDLDHSPWSTQEVCQQ
jgi:hypothetical protein